MESTAQYWKPVWQALEGRYRLELAQARNPTKRQRGASRDFADAERLARRYVAGELILSFVAERRTARLWRTMMTRTKQQLTRDRVAAAGAVGGISGRGADQAFQPRQRSAGPERPTDDTGAGGRGNRPGPDHSRHWRRTRAESDTGRVTGRAERRGHDEPLAAPGPRFISGTADAARNPDGHTLERSAAEALRQHQASVQRLAAVPGLGADSAQQIIAEVGPGAATFRFCRADGLVDRLLSLRKGRKRGGLKKTTLDRRKATWFMRAAF